MKRHTPLRRTRPLPKRGKGQRFRGYVRDAAYQDWIRSLPCLVGEACAGRIEAAHVVSRGAGGRDPGNLAPLCTTHHREQHAIGIRSFEKRYGLDLTATARALWTQYQGEQ